MSWDAVKLALQYGQERELTASQRLLLVRLANHWNEAKGYGWPSVATLACEVGCSERHVQRDLKVLEQQMVVAVVRRGGRRPGGKGRPSLYRLLFMEDTVTASHPIEGEDGENGEKGDTQSEKGDTQSRPQIEKGDTQSPDPPTIEPPSDTRTARARVSPDGDARKPTRRKKKAAEPTNGSKPTPLSPKELEAAAAIAAGWPERPEEQRLQLVRVHGAVAVLACVKAPTWGRFLIDLGKRATAGVRGSARGGAAGMNNNVHHYLCST